MVCGHAVLTCGYTSTVKPSLWHMDMLADMQLYMKHILCTHGNEKVCWLYRSKITQ